MERGMQIPMEKVWVEFTIRQKLFIVHKNVFWGVNAGYE